MSVLYEKIEGLCDSKGIKVGRMCADIGIHRSVLGNLSSGKSKTLSTKNLKLIAEYFNIPIDYLIDLGEPDPSDIPPEPPISKEQLMFALWGEQKDELSDEDLEDVKKYADMVRLRKLEEKRKMEG